MLAVEDLMTRDVLTLAEDENLAVGDDLLKLHHIRHLPVVRDGKLVGLVSHRDLIRALARQAGSRSRNPVWARDVMSRDVDTVTPRTSVREVVDLLLDHKYGCLPVVDGDRKLVGIITESDLVRLAGQLLDERERAPAAPAPEAPRH
ncbi:CBS domain-containing protein [Myxococcaceae bacterium GXIMD 01537]